MTRALFRLIAVLGLSAGLSGCGALAYTAQSLEGHVKIMAARRDVAALIADPSTPPALRRQLAEARAIRQFAVEALALPDNESYRDYADIGRDHVTLAVYAAPEFALAPRLWCFPAFGCVPYRGYFSEKSAREMVAELRRQGLDVHVGGVIAYSTLGWMSDPLLSTMFGPDGTALAGLVFHELAHQRVYVAGDSAFNEAFAVAVETTGVEKWLRAKGDAAGLRRFEVERQREADFLALVARTRDELASIYASGEPPEKMRAAKAAAIERLRANYRRIRDGRWGGYRGYDGWIDAPINNAKLAATAVYNARVPAFLRLFDLCAGDYPRFYEAVRRIGGLKESGRADALDRAKSCD
ncbi:MAG: aminopeptidase [Phyllobacteriaceae bacterium]|nr:aminopeptidase [Phyllobacteriaceae bacterium]